MNLPQIETKKIRSSSMKPLPLTAQRRAELMDLKVDNDCKTSYLQNDVPSNHLTIVLIEKYFKLNETIDAILSREK